MPEDRIVHEPSESTDAEPNPKVSGTGWSKARSKIKTVLNLPDNPNMMPPGNESRRIIEAEVSVHTAR
jgi:hypothetical protein